MRSSGESDLEGHVFHGRKGDISFSSTPAGDVVALGVRAGAELTITGVTGGKVLVMNSSAMEPGQSMVIDAQASHYPDLSGNRRAATHPRHASPSSTPVGRSYCRPPRCGME